MGHRGPGPGNTRVPLELTGPWIGALIRQYGTTTTYARSRKVSISWAVGRDGSAPSLVVARAPAALARRNESDTGNPFATAAANTPQKASPAAVASTC